MTLRVIKITKYLTQVIITSWIKQSRLDFMEKLSPVISYINNFCREQNILMNIKNLQVRPSRKWEEGEWVDWAFGIDQWEASIQDNWPITGLESIAIFIPSETIRSMSGKQWLEGILLSKYEFLRNIHCKQIFEWDERETFKRGRNANMLQENPIKFTSLCHII